MAELNRQFNAEDRASPAVRQRIAQLRKDLAEIQKRMNELGRDNDGQEAAKVETQASESPPN